MLLRSVDTKKLRGKWIQVVFNFTDWINFILSEDWDILWVERDSIYEILNNFHLSPTQRINHYRNHFELTRKDLMVKNLKRYKKQIEKEGRYDEAAQ